jgi:hypothetical protein
MKISFVGIASTMTLSVGMEGLLVAVNCFERFYAV